MDPLWVDPGVKQVIRHPVVIEKPGGLVCLEAQVFYYKPPRKRERPERADSLFLFFAKGRKTSQRNSRSVRQKGR